MIKSSILASLISIWLFAVFAPSIISYITHEESFFISVNLTDEEPQEQSKKDNSEEKTLLQYGVAHIGISPKERKFLSDQPETCISPYPIEIPIPPPEFVLNQA